MKECEHLLTEGEKNRNKHGPMYQYECLSQENDATDGTITKPIYVINEITRKDVFKLCDFFFFVNIKI